MENNQHISNQSIEDILSEFIDDTKPNEEFDAEGKPIISEEKVVEPEIKEDVINDDFFNALDEKFFKSNKLIPFNNEDGSDYVIPKTTEEFAELLDANKEQWIKDSKYNQKEEILADIFKETTPAFQFLVQNANLYSKIEDMYPLINSLQAQEDLDSIDMSNEEHQEYVVRAALRIQRFSEESIDAEIQDLKERSKLESKANFFKLDLDKIQAQETSALLEQEHQKNIQDQQFWNSYYTSLNENLIMAKDLDGMVLQENDKVRIANNLIPSTDGTGLPIYSKLDKLIGENDTTTLSIISMLLEDKALFDSYYANKTHDQAGKSSARTLRVGFTAKASEEDNVAKKQQPRKVDPNKSYGNFL